MSTYTISLVVEGKDHASGPLGGIGKTLGNIGTIAAGIISAQTLTSIANGIANIGREALDSYANFERLGMSLQSLSARELMNTGAAKNMTDAMAQAAPIAKDLQGWITKLAIQSPFDQDGVAIAFRTALAYGFTTKEAQRLTQATIDFASASGGSTETMNRIGLALGQIKAKGRLAGQEMLQLTEAGLPVRDILAKAFGVTTEELIKMQEKGLIPADQAIEAITKSLENDFGGAAKAQANTFSGLLSSLQDIRKVGLRELFGGVFKAAQPALEKFTATLSSPEFMAALSRIGEEAGKFIGPMIAGIGEFFAKVGTVIQYLQGGGSFGMGIISYLFGADAADKLSAIITFFQPLVDAFGNFFGVIQESAPMVQEYLQAMWDFLINVITTYGPVIIENLAGIVNSLATIWQEHGAQIMNVVGAIWEFIVATIGGALILVTGIINAALQLIQGNWQAAWDILKETFEAFLNLVLSLVGTNLEEFTAVWKSNFDNLKVIVQFGLDTVKQTLADAVGALVQAGKNLVEGIRQGFSDAWASFMSWIDSQVTGLPDWIKSMLGIHSPSSVFAEIGASMMEGLQVGVDRNLNLPVNAVGNAAAQTVYNFNLGIQTSQSSEVVQMGFAGMRALAGV